MKKIYSTIAVIANIFIFNNISSAQCTTVSVYNQAQVDNFATSGCSSLSGSLTIQGGFGGDITNLNGLSSITSIGGDLIIAMNTSLSNLSGLSNLQSIGGNLNIYYSGIKNLAGLGNLQQISGTLALDHNDSLLNLIGISPLLSLGGMSISGTNAILNLNALNSITHISGNVFIQSYYGMANLNGLESLKTINGSLALDGIGNIDGLDSLQSINGSLSIKSASTLTDLSSIANVSGINYLTLQNNPNLTICNVNSICTFLNSSGCASGVINTNGIGCNSTQQVILGCNSNTTNLTACDSYIFYGQNYTTSGTYTQIVPNVGGCDSAISINLTIISVDASVSFNGNTLTANEANSSYQWIDCDNSNALIVGATNQNYTPIANGNYSVVLTKNGCSYTSTCTNVLILSVLELEKTNSIVIYPNPASNIISVKLKSNLLGSEYTIFDPFGRMVMKGKLTKEDLSINISELSIGIYSFKIGEKNQQTFIVMKE
jgi:hypothetical protein